jgi:hypothetical protein
MLFVAIARSRVRIREVVIVGDSASSEGEWAGVS